MQKHSCKLIKQTFIWIPCNFNKFWRALVAFRICLSAKITPKPRVALFSFIFDVSLFLFFIFRCELLWSERKAWEFSVKNIQNGFVILSAILEYKGWVSDMLDLKNRRNKEKIGKKEKRGKREKRKKREKC